MQGQIGKSSKWFGWRVKNNMSAWYDWNLIGNMRINQKVPISTGFRNDHAHFTFQRFFHDYFTIKIPGEQAILPELMVDLQLTVHKFGCFKC